MTDRRTNDQAPNGPAQETQGATAGEAVPEAVPETEVELLTSLQLQMLARMRGIVMEIGERVGRKAAGILLEREENAFKHCDPILGAVRLTRSMLQIMAMEQEIMGLREKHRQEVRVKRASEKKVSVRRAVEDTVRKQRLDLDRFKVKNLLDDLFDDYADFDRGNPRETVIRICQELGIEPDLSIWLEAGKPAAAERADVPAVEAPMAGCESRPQRNHANGHDPP